MGKVPDKAWATGGDGNQAPGLPRTYARVKHVLASANRNMSPPVPSPHRGAPQEAQPDLWKPSWYVTASAMACVSAAEPERQQKMWSWICVSLSVTRLAMYELREAGEAVRNLPEPRVSLARGSCGPTHSHHCNECSGLGLEGQARSTFLLAGEKAEDPAPEWSTPHP